MTMTAISKGFRRIMKLLSECGKPVENNVDFKAMWTNKIKTVQTEDQNDECLGLLNLFSLKCLPSLKRCISITYVLKLFKRVYRLPRGKTSEAAVTGKILAHV